MPSLRRVNNLFEMNDSIDEVIQGGAPTRPPAPRPINIRPNVSALSVNRSQPLSPIQSSPTSTRREQHDNLTRSSGPRKEAYGAVSGERMDREARSRPVTRDSDEHSRSSRSGNTLIGSGYGGNGSGNQMVDFFSGEVFQIVIHNPTTAHRFLRFCQSRNCGENMEFLQKVR